MAAETTPLNGPRRAGRTGFPMGLCKAAGPCGERGTEPSGLFAARRKEGGSVSFSEVRSDGLFPRYQGKACVRTPPSGRFFYRQFGWHRRSFKTFVPKVPVMGPFVGWRSFFDASPEAAGAWKERMSWFIYLKQKFPGFFSFGNCTFFRFVVN